MRRRLAPDRRAFNIGFIPLAEEHYNLASATTVCRNRPGGTGVSQCALAFNEARAALINVGFMPARLFGYPLPRNFTHAEGGLVRGSVTVTDGDTRMKKKKISARNALKGKIVDVKKDHDGSCHDRYRRSDRNRRDHE